MGLSFALLAVHIFDGVLSDRWIAGGLALMVVLMIPALVRVRDEEIPRIALLTAAFFVASLIHVRLGPTSVHLLLNGLVGVILGWRAGLAIPVGLALQAALLGHGGFSSLGVNACVMTIPALLCGGFFALLRRVAWLRHPWFRSGCVALVLIGWAELTLFGAWLLLHTPGTSWTNADVASALRVVIDPWALVGMLLLGVVGAVVERRLETSPHAILGFFIGLGGVLLTLLLNAFALRVGGAEDWRPIVLFVFVAHLPIAILEGIIMGFTVSFLSRVKPDLLVGWQPVMDEAPAVRETTGQVRALHGSSQALKAPAPLRQRTLLLVLAGLLLSAGPLWAHRLDAAYTLLPDGRIEIESWFETGDTPPEARVQVYHHGDKLLTEGTLDAAGKYVFKPERGELLRVVINAGAGHRKEFSIPGNQGQPAGGAIDRSTAEPAPRVGRRSYEVPYKDVLTGIGFVLAVAAFFLSLRNARALKAIQQSRRADQHKSEDTPN